MRPVELVHEDVDFFRLRERRGGVVEVDQAHGRTARLRGSGCLWSTSRRGEAGRSCSKSNQPTRRCRAGRLEYGAAPPSSPTAGAGRRAFPGPTARRTGTACSTSRDPDGNQARVSTFLGPVAILDFDASAALTHAEIRGALRQSPIGELDLVIAAVARAHGLTLVTGNTREPSRVPDLPVEDWRR
ncbi:MAG: type II toxin-antitoxin system VapC family toxin [Longimicrobiales bacterium]